MVSCGHPRSSALRSRGAGRAPSVVGLAAAHQLPVPFLPMGPKLEHPQDTSSRQSTEPNMGRFGSLFRKSDDKKSEQADANPYAQQPSGDSYSPQAPSSASFQSNSAHNNNQYRQNQAGLPSGPRPGAHGGGLDRDSAPPPYNQSPSLHSSSDKKYSPSPSPSGFANDRFGAQNGWGGNRYDASSSQNNAPPPQRPGGYGGLDDNALFKGYAPPSNRDAAQGSQQQQFAEDDQYGNRHEMTEEERENYEVSMKKAEINQVRLETEDAMDRILGKIDEANRRADDTMVTLGTQGEVLHHANQSIGEASVQSRIAKANVKDLEDANKSMFNFYAMSRKRRDQLNDERLVAEYQEKEERQLARQEAQQAKSRVNQRMGQGSQTPVTLGATKAADRSKFLFEESDGEQEEREKRIEDKTARAYQGVLAIKQKMLAVSDELDDQAVMIDRLADKSTASTPTTSGKENARSGKAHSTGRRPIGDPKYFQARQALPLWSRQDDIRRILQHNDVLVLVGETGSGKSTQVPQFLIQEKWCQKRRVKVKMSSGGDQEANVGGVIAITQPRRVAATTLAHRVSREAGTPLNGQKAVSDGKAPLSKGLVGYSVRFDHHVPSGTKIKYVTEGMLLQELLRDPHLRQYSAIIVDEIHERSVDVDLLSGFLKQILSGDKAGRGGIPLKVVIMSATANVGSIKDFFSDTGPTDSDPGSSSQAKPKTSLEFLQIEGRQFPVEIVHTPKPIPDIQEALMKTLFKIHTEETLSDKHGKKDILAFLTGQEEIESAQKLIEEYASTLPPNVPKVKVFPLYGQLSMEAQHEAFQPIKGNFARKIVLATNIAETSVTVPGVRFVIDCGKAKVKQYRARLGMESLLAKPISKSSAIQRAGRAGREGPGKCFRLYTEETYETLQKTDLPEILRTDILSAVLTMKARGIGDVLAFPLMDPPEFESVEKALLHLHFLGALADDGAITETGRKMVMFPVTPPYARVLLAAADPKYDCLLEVIDIISCITAGDDIFLQTHSEEAREEVEGFRKELRRREGDLITYLTTMQLYTAENADRGQWCKDRKINTRNMKQALNIRKQLRGLCVKQGMMEQPPPDPQQFYPTSPEQAATILKCFLKGFALKTAILAPDSSYVTAHGKHVVAIHPASVLHGQKKEAIMFLEHVYTQKNYAKKVSAIQASWIIEAVGGA
ncbi:P-loop containing nucleoside triphosphate hydrolase protein [Cladorrhinum samala]|uniref:RNA helicase n=1 Tax=Cladorrhinum samala TaxID=585594 RepID=A0AAV9HFI8_9PEZI|nr:P-loop containing nucleoside triphosphate hydrolase protein [Cladorrhinum samala]